MARPRNCTSTTTLTEEIVITARKRHAAGESIEQMAVEYGVSYETLRKAIKGLTWGWVNEQDFVARRKEAQRLEGEAANSLEKFLEQNPDLVKGE